MTVRRERVTVHLHLPEGTETTEAIIRTGQHDGPDDFAGRFAALAAELPQIDGVRIIQLSCDGCGATGDVDERNPQYPDGWREQPGGDYCPNCQP